MSILSQSTKGKQELPPFIIVYGSGGLGKSTFASEAPKPIILDVEGSTNNLDVERVAVQKFVHVREALHELATTKHGFKTVGIDTLDAMEVLLHKQICEEDNVSNIEKAAGGYGKAYKACIQVYSDMHAEIVALQRQGVQTIALCHDLMVTYKDPTTDNDYSRFRMKLNDSAAASSAKFWYDRADVVLFAKRKAVSVGDSGRALDAGGHFLYTQGRAAFDAKSRYQVPFELPLRWQAWEDAMATKTRSDIQVKASIASLAGEVKDATVRAKIQERVNMVKTVAELEVIETRIKEILSTQGV